MKKNILFIYRNSGLLDILASPDSKENPTEFLWGLNEVNREQFNVTWVNAPRLQRRKGIRLFTNFLEFPFARLTKIGFPIEIYPLFRKQIREADEIVCVNDQISLGVLFWRLFGFLRNKKVHCIVMSLQERVKYFRSKKLLLWFVGKLLRQSDTILTLSKVVWDDFEKDYGLDRNKFRKYYFGIDTNFWFSSEKPKKGNYILSIGNDMNRDFQTLVDALPLDCHLKLVTKKRIHDKGKSIEFISGVSNKELRSIYQNARLVIIPSIRLKNESSGLSTCMQAMACGRPVIISDAPPMREMFVDGEDCLFYKPEDVDDLRKKIDKILSDEVYCQQLGKTGQQKVRDFYTTHQMGQKLNIILSEN